ncbi:MAG: DNA damage-inducible protein D [Chloroflexota bacterium]|nr:DNA damage-inducible protein D [Chloroflexota bacterium]
MTGDFSAPPRSPFEDIRHATDAGADFWWGRELADLLGYDSWRNFRSAVDRARLACANTGYPPVDHFVDQHRMVAIGSGATRRVADVQLSRYACYLTVQNGDSAKSAVALGQSYFATRTEEAEAAAALAGETEPQRRLRLRKDIARHNRTLATTARAAGVLQPSDFAIFQDHGYMGLYHGERTRDIAARKGLVPGQHILDHMGAAELAANMFRITQTEAKLRHEGITDKAAANAAAEHVGSRVRQFMIEESGTAPEDLPTPAESIQEVAQAERKRLARGPQRGMFDEEPHE